MNGTSMASPHTAGAVSLLLSGMKQRKAEFSPFSVKRAISVTAKALPHLCAYGQGHGLLQVAIRCDGLKKKTFLFKFMIWYL